MGQWCPIELAGIFWLRKNIKKIMSTLGRPWGIPTRESGLAKGPKMAKNSDFGLRTEKIRKTSKIWSYKSTT